TLTNNGTLTLWPGTTNRLAGGGSATGAFTTPTTALVEWVAAGASAFILNAGAALNGAGLYQLNDLTLTVNGNLAVQNFNLVGGSAALNGSATVTVSNVLNWTAGTMSGSGRTIIAPGAT